MPQFLETMRLRFLLFILHFWDCIESSCRLTGSELTSISMDGNIIIGAVMPVHIDEIYPKVNYKERPGPANCITFRLDNYQRAQAVHFAVEEINKTPDILPNITLGFKIFDCCKVLQRAVSGTLQLLSGYGESLPNYRCNQETQLAAVIGHSISTYAISMAHILGLYRYPQLLHYMKKLHLNTSNGRQLFFDKNGDPPAVYDIVNWQLSPEGQIQQVKVGSYDTSITSGNIFTINTSHVHWGTGNLKVPVSVCSPRCPPGFRKAAINGQPSCCFQCIPCPYGEISSRTDSLHCTECPWDMWPNPTQDHCVPKTQEFLSHEDPLGITLTTTGISSSLVPVVIFGLFIHYRTTPIVRANNYSLSCLLLLSLSLCFLSSLVFIGYPQYEICLLRQVTFGVVFSLCVSCILAKTLMVVIAFNATRPGSQLRKWTSPRVSYLIVISCILIQIFICIMWLTFSPPFSEVNSESNSGVLVIQCNEGSPLAFWSMLGYLSLLAFISFIVAFLARRLPDSFNEAKFITFSMLAFLSVWLSYIPASLSSRGKYMVAMEIFAIQSSTWGLVICMFILKCYIIVFRPDMNSREKLMSKQKNFN